MHLFTQTFQLIKSQSIVYQHKFPDNHDYNVNKILSKEIQSFGTQSFSSLLHCALRGHRKTFSKNLIHLRVIQKGKE